MYAEAIDVATERKLLYEVLEERKTTVLEVVAQMHRNLDRVKENRGARTLDAAFETIAGVPEYVTLTDMMVSSLRGPCELKPGNDDILDSPSSVDISDDENWDDREQQAHPASNISSNQTLEECTRSTQAVEEGKNETHTSETVPETDDSREWVELAQPKSTESCSNSPPKLKRKKSRRRPIVYFVTSKFRRVLRSKKTKNPSNHKDLKTTKAPPKHKKKSHGLMGTFGSIKDIFGSNATQKDDSFSVNMEDVVAAFEKSRALKQEDNVALGKVTIGASSDIKQYEYYFSQLTIAKDTASVSDSASEASDEAMRKNVRDRILAANPKSAQSTKYTSKGGSRKGGSTNSSQGIGESLEILSIAGSEFSERTIWEEDSDEEE